MGLAGKLPVGIGGLTVFALTSRETKDGGKLTKQFFKGTRATSAVVEGFLGAMIRAQSCCRRKRWGRTTSPELGLALQAGLGKSTDLGSFGRAECTWSHYLSLSYC